MAFNGFTVLLSLWLLATPSGVWAKEQGLSNCAGLASRLSLHSNDEGSLTAQFLQEQSRVRHYVRTEATYGPETQGGYRQLVAIRVAQYGHTWREGISLQETIARLLGLEPEVVRDGAKIFYLARNNILGILEDPIGHYFRIFRVLDGARGKYFSYLDLNGRAFRERLSTPQFNAQTHFRYSDFSTETRVETEMADFLKTSAHLQEEALGWTQGILELSQQEGIEQIRRAAEKSDLGTLRLLSVNIERLFELGRPTAATLRQQFCLILRAMSRSARNAELDLFHSSRGLLGANPCTP